MQPITEELVRELKDRIVSGVHPDKIILFGSYDCGTPAKNSDLDLLVIMPTDKPVHNFVLKIWKVLRDFRIHRDILVYKSQEVEKWKNVTMAFITSVMEGEKVIYG